jgi:hypothetical protein
MKRYASVLILLSATTALTAASQDLSAEPARPTHFLVPETEHTGQIAREIARRVATFPNLRAHIPGIWRHDQRAVWSIRPEQQCLDELRRIHVQAEPFHAMAAIVALVPNPVRVEGHVPLENGGNVYFRKNPNSPLFVISCELAARLPYLAAAVAPLGINQVDIDSAWRDNPYTSFHTMGLGFDIRAFHGPAGEWRVERNTDFPMDRRRPTCPAAASAPLLYRAACAIGDTGHFSTVLTPNYNAGHRRHFHVDIRPDDPRVYVR